MSSKALWYVYGIVPAESAASSAPTGLDDAPVSVEHEDGNDVAALVSVLDGPEYTPEQLEARSGDVEWVSPRAVAHDRVLTWASDLGPVVPMPMFTLFSGQRAVHDMLRDRGSQLSATLTRIGKAREYALRVYRIDAELLGAISSLSPRLQELSATAAAASPGQRYLLERKLDGEKRAEIRTVTQQIVDELLAAVAPHARQTARSPIPRMTDAETARGTMVLNSAFLVGPERLDAFRAALTGEMARRSAQGFRFDFTGPWPPYHFVNELDAA